MYIPKRPIGRFFVLYGAFITKFSALSQILAMLHLTIYNANKAFILSFFDNKELTLKY